MAERGKWKSRTAFIFAAVGSAVGLGNVWRFPYICYDNGGGAFLIPYFVALFTTGIPLLILELSLGHKMRRGAPQSLRALHPKSEWLGWTQIFMSGVVGIYYAIVMAWCWAYLAHSLDLAWGSDAKGFFFGEVLGVTDSPWNFDGIRWPLLVGLFLTWLSVYFIIVKGVHVVSQIVLITVPLPVLLLVVFVIRGVTLPGAAEGLDFYLSPDFSKLLEPKVWLAAYGQIFFSLSLGFGVMIAYASYLPKRSDVTNNAFITALANCGTSFFAGFAVFSALGFLAQSSGGQVADVVSSGPGLAFVTFPTLIAKLPFGGVAFALIFFIMLLALGIDSLFSIVEGVVTGIDDEWRLPRKRLVATVCGLGFLGGVVLTTGSGLLWLDIIDHHINYLVLPLVGLVECVAVAFLLGPSVLRNHTNSVSDFSIGKWWDFCIVIVTPLFMGTMFIIYLVRRIQEPYEGYPQSALFFGGWAIFIVLFTGGVLAMLLRRRMRPIHAEEGP
jgi:NSS family neurotransmitter:Na+ symporter